MNKELIEMLKQLGEKMGTTGEHLWTVLIKQQPINSLIDVFSISVLTLISWKLYQWVKTQENIMDHPVLPFLFCWVIFCLILYLSFIFCLPTIIAGFFNPEYSAMQDLFNMVDTIK